MRRLIILKLMLLIQVGLTAQENQVFNIGRWDTLHVGVQARGEVRWEKSFDRQTWEEIKEEKGSLLAVIASESAYYRAKVSESNCDSVFSDTTHVRVMPVNGVPVSIGIQRWDAWAPDNDPGSPYNQALECMKPEKWNELGYWPWWATVDQSGNLMALDGNRLEVAEQENRYAHESQVDYWAFYRYVGDANPMNQLFQRYLESSTKSLVDFCFIATPQLYRGGNDNSEIISMVCYMKDPQYFRVVDGRPLIYFYLAHMTLREVRDYFSRVRQEAALAGIADPYIVLYNNSWEWSYEDVQDLGQDAFSDIPKPGCTEEGSPYQKMIEELPPLWESWAGANDYIVPCLSQQWDPRPYYETPPEWWPKPDNRWFHPPTKDQFRQNVQNALDFVKEHPGQCPSRTIIIKEWSGFPEGAVIVPSLKKGTMYIDALGAVTK